MLQTLSSGGYSVKSAALYRDNVTGMNILDYCLTPIASGNSVLHQNTVLGAWAHVGSVQNLKCIQFTGCESFCCITNDVQLMQWQVLHLALRHIATANVQTRRRRQVIVRRPMPCQSKRKKLHNVSSIGRFVMSPIICRSLGYFTVVSCKKKTLLMSLEPNVVFL